MPCSDAGLLLAVRPGPPPGSSHGGRCLYSDNRGTHALDVVDDIIFCINHLLIHPRRRTDGHTDPTAPVTAAAACDYGHVRPASTGCARFLVENAVGDVSARPPPPPRPSRLRRYRQLRPAKKSDSSSNDNSTEAEQQREFQDARSIGTATRLTSELILYTAPVDESPQNLGLWEYPATILSYDNCFFLVSIVALYRTGRRSRYRLTCAAVKSRDSGRILPPTSTTSAD